jgi:hypothetical protein
MIMAQCRSPAFTPGQRAPQCLGIQVCRIWLCCRIGHHTLAKENSMASELSLVKPKRTAYDDRSVLAYDAESNLSCAVAAAGLTFMVVSLFFCPLTTPAVIAYVGYAALGAPSAAIGVALTCFV